MKSHSSQNCRKGKGPCQSLKIFKLSRLWEQIVIAVFVCKDIHLSFPSPICICLCPHQHSNCPVLSLSPRDLSSYVLYPCQAVIALIIQLPLSLLWTGKWKYHFPCSYCLPAILAPDGNQGSIIPANLVTFFCACWIIGIKNLNTTRC